MNPKITQIDAHGITANTNRWFWRLDGYIVYCGLIDGKANEGSKS